MHAASVLEYDIQESLLISVLDEGLGFEFDHDTSTGEITITNKYQLRRIIAEAKPGSSVPNTTASRTVAGPYNLYFFQFDTEDEARAANLMLNNHPDIVFAEPDRVIFVPSLDQLMDSDQTESPRGASRSNMDSSNAIQLYEMTQFDQYLDTVPQSNVAHLSWGPERMGAARFAEHLIANNNQNVPIIVAVIDTGVNTSLPFFAGRLVPGRNVADNNNDVTDRFNHGTAMAAAVIDTTLTIPGIRVMPIKVDFANRPGVLYQSMIIAGIRWATNNGARVINISTGGACYGYSMHSVINDALNRGITIVAAAGDSNVSANDLCPHYFDDVITVAAFCRNDRPFHRSNDWASNFGSVIDIAAPGAAINRLHNTGLIAEHIGGSSLAAPHVAGAAAMLIAEVQNRTPAMVKSALTIFSDPFPVSWHTGRYGAGILNIGNAGPDSSRISVVNRGSHSITLNLTFPNSNSVDNHLFFFNLNDPPPIMPTRIMNPIQNGNHTFSGLSPGTTYAFRMAWFENGRWNYNQVILTAAAMSISNISPGSATVNLMFPNSNSVDNHLFLFNLNDPPPIMPTRVINPIHNGLHTLSGLARNTPHVIRMAWVENERWHYYQVPFTSR